MQRHRKRGEVNRLKALAHGGQGETHLLGRKADEDAAFVRGRVRGGLVVGRRTNRVVLSSAEARELIELGGEILDKQQAVRTGTAQ